MSNSQVDALNKIIFEAEKGNSQSTCSPPAVSPFSLLLPRVPHLPPLPRMDKNFRPPFQLHRPIRPRSYVARAPRNPVPYERKKNKKPVGSKEKPVVVD